MNRLTTAWVLRYSYLWLAVTVCAALPASAAAKDKAAPVCFTKAMDQLAADIASFLKNDKAAAGAVQIGSFEGPGSGGPRIAAGLKARLEKDPDVSISLFGGYKLVGKYEQGKHEGKHVTVITAGINNSAGNLVREIPRRIVTSTQLQIELFGPAAVDLTEVVVDSDKPGEQPVRDAGVEGERIVRAITAPANFIGADPRGVASSVARFSQNAPYSVQIVRRDTSVTTRAVYRPVIYKTSDPSGFASVGLGAGDVYGIRIFNQSGRPVGVSITIDGLNIFAFSQNTAWRKLGKLVVPTGGATIRGWHHAGTISHEFVITQYGNSAAAQFNQIDGVGTITVAFHEVKLGEGSKAVNATGLGGKITTRYKESRASFTNLLGAVSLKYLRPIHPEGLPD